MDIAKFISPVSDESPAGTDLNETGALYELENLVKGKPETQFSAAEEADWRAVQRQCEDLFAQTRDLRVATIYTAALLRNRALEGFTAGLAIIRAYLETFWEPLHPRLDPEDDNDPQERINAINNLAAPIGTIGDPFKILEILHKTPVTISREAGNWGLDAILAVKENRPLLTGAPAPSGATIDGAFADTGPERLQVTLDLLDSAIEHTTAINAWFTETIHVGAPSLAPLLKDLKRLRDAVAAHLSDNVSSAGSSDSETKNESQISDYNSSMDSPRSSANDRRLAGEISSRDEVTKALDLINAFYARNEPASPIPLFIERVKRLVPMTFPEIIKELTPDAMERITLLTGYENKTNEEF